MTKATSPATDDSSAQAQTVVDAFKQSSQRKATASAGHTSYTYIQETDSGRYVIKTLRSHGPYRWWGRQLLRREYQAYKRMSGFTGAPQCLGLVEDTFLVLRWVDGDPLRRSHGAVSEEFLQQLHDDIGYLHQQGIAHGDLKEKNNILVSPQHTPVLIDFGTAVCRKDGFHPLNHLLFRFMCRLDNHAFLKHQDRIRRGVVQRQERMAYQATPAETASKMFREVLKWLTRGFKNF